MTSCGDIRDALLRGESLSGANLRAHLESCPACALLAESSGLPRVLLKGEAAPSIDTNALLARVKGRIAEERDAASWLRSRPTWMRRLIALSTSGLLIMYGLYAVRPDAEVYPANRMVLSLVAWTIALLFTTFVALRPSYRPALSVQALVAISVACLSAVFVVSALPAAHEAHPASLASFGPDAFPKSVPCFVFGTLIALPVYAVSRLLDHRTSRMVAVISAVAAGLTANITLQLHCPATNPVHLLMGHFSVALLLVVVVALISVVPWERLARK